MLSNSYFIFFYIKGLMFIFSKVAVNLKYPFFSTGVDQENYQIDLGDNGKVGKRDISFKWRCFDNLVTNSIKDKETFPLLSAIRYRQFANLSVAQIVDTTVKVDCLPNRCHQSVIAARHKAGQRGITCSLNILICQTHTFGS